MRASYARCSSFISSRTRASSDECCASVGVAATSATIDVLPVRGTYDYKIRALNQNTPGPWSAVKQFTVVT